MKTAVAVLVLSLLVGCGSGSSSAARFSPTTTGHAKQLMIRYLESKYLTYHWVACLKTGRSFQSAAIVRCNVNFGDPHIEAYCIVLKGGKLYSDHDDPRIPCRRDNRAPPATIVTS